MGKAIEKPKFDTDQLISASDAAKRFGELRRKAQDAQQFILDNGKVNTVVIGYEYYEQLFARLMELEEAEEIRMLSSRIARLEREPSSGVSWRNIRQKKVKS